MANMFFLAMTFLLPLLLFIFLKNGVFRSTTRLPPGPFAWQILANISQIGKEPHVAFQNMAKSYGPLFSFRLGGQILVVASSPATAKEILKTHDQILSGRYFPSLYYKVPHVSQTSLTLSRECDDKWKFLRSIGQKCIFSSKAVESKAKIRKMKVKDMVDYIKGKEGEILDFEDLVAVTFTNTMSTVLASTNIFCINGEDESAKIVKAFMNEIVEMVAAPGLGDLFPMLRKVDYWSQRKAMDLDEKIKFIWGDIIKERRARGDKINSTQDFLDVLTENSFSDDQICILLTELLVAGTSTTVATVWLMVEMMKHEEILQRIRHEVAEAIEGDLINESCLSQSPYLQACLKETLRFHIPGPFLLPHRAIQTCKVNNCTIPKDSIVLVNAWAIAQDPGNWNEATTFKPERFLNSKVDFRGNYFEFIPFSAGNRMCPGSTFAIRNIQSVVAALVHYFDWSLSDGSTAENIDTNDQFSTTLKKEKPLCLIPKLREQSFYV